MEQLWIFAVARPWHYWLGVAFTVVGVVSLLAIAAGYYREVLVPLERYRTRQLESSSPGASLTAAEPRRLDSSSPRQVAPPQASQRRRPAVA